MAYAIPLDTVIAALTWAIPKWTPKLKRNQSEQLLHTLIRRLYGVNNNLFKAKYKLSQDALAQDLGLSREWVCKLLARLEAGGWITAYASRLPDGHFTTCTFRIGRKLKRLLYVLGRSNKNGKNFNKKGKKNRVNNRSQSLPLSPSLKKEETKTREQNEKVGLRPHFEKLISILEDGLKSPGTAKTKVKEWLGGEKSAAPLHSRGGREQKTG